MENTELVSRMDRIIHWVEVCDTKTSIILAVQAMILTVICSTDFVFDAIKQILVDTFFINGEKVFCFWSLLVLVFAVILIISFASSIYHLFLVLEAKTNADQTKEENVRDVDSLIHFQCIANKEEFKSYNDFKERINIEKDDDVRNDLISQIYINAVRCNEKFDEYNKGLSWLKRALVVLVLFVLSVLLFQASIIG